MSEQANSLMSGVAGVAVTGIGMYAMFKTTEMVMKGFDDVGKTGSSHHKKRRK